jgi:hypothetical protein
MPPMSHSELESLQVVQSQLTSTTAKVEVTAIKIEQVIIRFDEKYLALRSDIQGIDAKLDQIVQSLQGPQGIVVKMTMLENDAVKRSWLLRTLIGASICTAAAGVLEYLKHG